jgi:hypothetical protein
MRVPAADNAGSGCGSSETVCAKLMQELVIEDDRSERHYWQDLWRYREFSQVLGWRDVSVRYKQTVIGLVWALIRPFLMMVVFTIIFGKVAKLPSDGTASYALMVFAGMPPWSFFFSALSDTSKPAQQRASDQQGVFPKIDRAHCGGGSGRGGFLHQLPDSGGNDGLA